MDNAHAITFEVTLDDRYCESVARKHWHLVCDERRAETQTATLRQLAGEGAEFVLVRVDGEPAGFFIVSGEPIIHGCNAVWVHTFLTARGKMAVRIARAGVEEWRARGKTVFSIVPRTPAHRAVACFVHAVGSKVVGRIKDAWQAGGKLFPVDVVRLDGGSKCQ